MEPAKTLFIIRCLANGVDPETGETLAPAHSYQRPDTIRALFAAVQALERTEMKPAFPPSLSPGQPLSLPPNMGRPWDNDEDKRLCSGFSSGTDLSELAAAHGRTFGDIRARLEALGQVTADAPQNAASELSPESDVPEGVYVFRKMALSR